MVTNGALERLQTLTQQAGLHFRSRLLNPEAHVRARASSAAYTLSIAQTMTSSAARVLGTDCHALWSLPRHVLRRICRYLSLGETMRLSATSRGMRAALLGIPDLWTEVYTDSVLQQRGPATLDTQVLASYLDRSGQEALDVDISTAYNLLVTADQAPVLAQAMHRVSRLRIDFCCDTPHCTRRGWQCLNQQVLGEPAPLLRVLDITAFSGPTDNPGDPGWSTLGKLSLGSDLFGGAAPRLQVCRLADVRLPPREHCGIFVNVTALCYDICGEVVSDDLVLIAAVMPLLETFKLGCLVLCGNSSASEPSGPAFKLLRSLQLGSAASSVRRNNVLSSLISFQQLSELWLVETELETQIDVLLDFAALYPAMDSLSLSFHHHRLLGRLTCGKVGTPTHVVANKLPYHSLLSTWLARYPPLMHLDVHEIYLNNDVLGPPPPLPHLMTLVVRLARCVDWYYHGWECSGIIPDTTWVLPALREVRVTPALTSSDVESVCTGCCEYFLGTCMCARPLRIALREVVYWVRYGLAFEAEKLNRISFSGVQVVDLDFCAAWNEVLEIAHLADLDEGFDTRTSDHSGQWQDTFWS